MILFKILLTFYQRLYLKPIFFRYNNPPLQLHLPLNINQTNIYQLLFYGPNN
jgi:hypothetical protein